MELLGHDEVEPPVHTALMNRAFYPEERRDAAAADAAEKALAQPLRVLEGVLGKERQPARPALHRRRPQLAASSPGRGRPRSTCPHAKLASGSKSVARQPA